jgi:hypothetical protein
MRRPTQIHTTIPKMVLRQRTKIRLNRMPNKLPTFFFRFHYDQIVGHRYLCNFTRYGGPRNNRYIRHVIQ